jgi:hypothetical protein
LPRAEARGFAFPGAGTALSWTLSCKPGARTCSSTAANCAHPSLDFAAEIE